MFCLRIYNTCFVLLARFLLSCVANRLILFLFRTITTISIISFSSLRNCDIMAFNVATFATLYWLYFCCFVWWTTTISTISGSTLWYYDDILDPSVAGGIVAWDWPVSPVYRTPWSVDSHVMVGLHCQARCAHQPRRQCSLDSLTSSLTMEVESVTHTLRWTAARGHTCYRLHMFNELATESEKWNAKPRLECVNGRHSPLKTPVGALPWICRSEGKWLSRHTHKWLASRKI